MYLQRVNKLFKFLADLKVALFILFLIALVSAIGSVIEQDETLQFYTSNYSIENPVYGFINWKLILFFGFNTIYSTWWFSLLLVSLGISLITCSITRQFPILNNSKEYFFKKQKNSFLSLPFSVKLKNTFFLKENILKRLQLKNFYIYQYGNIIYGYRGLIGRISPILVHISLIAILVGSSWGAFNNFKAQELLPKGEIFHIQNLIKVGKITKIPDINTRVNDFWVEYQNDRIYQFYSNLSIIDSYGNEIKQQTISVNNPLRYKNVDFYQSDWNLLGIRVKDKLSSQLYELPLFNLKGTTKSWVTWLVNNDDQIQTLVFEQLQNKFTVYDEAGKFIKNSTLGEAITSNLQIVDIIPATGLQIKYDPSIVIIYSGFGLLMLTTLLSYLPYTQIWVFQENKNTWVGSTTNRGKITLEIEFENLIRIIEDGILKNIFVSQLKS